MNCAHSNVVVRWPHEKHTKNVAFSRTKGSRKQITAHARHFSNVDLGQDGIFIRFLNENRKLFRIFLIWPSCDSTSAQTACFKYQKSLFLHVRIGFEKSDVVSYGSTAIHFFMMPLACNNIKSHATSGPKFFQHQQDETQINKINPIRYIFTVSTNQSKEIYEKTETVCLEITPRLSCPEENIDLRTPLILDDGISKQSSRL